MSEFDKIETVTGEVLDAHPEAAFALVHVPREWSDRAWHILDRTPDEIYIIGCLRLQDRRASVTALTAWVDSSDAAAARADRAAQHNAELLGIKAPRVRHSTFDQIDAEFPPIYVDVIARHLDEPLIVEAVADWPVDWRALPVRRKPAPWPLLQPWPWEDDDDAYRTAMYDRYDQYDRQLAADFDAAVAGWRASHAEAVA